MPSFTLVPFGNERFTTMRRAPLSEFFFSTDCSGDMMTSEFKGLALNGPINDPADIILYECNCQQLPSTGWLICDWSKGQLVKISWCN